MWLWGLIAAVIIAVDQISKYLVMTNIGEHDTVTVIKNVFEFVYVQNTGAAFSIMSGKTGFLAAISVIFCIAIAVYMIKKKPTNKMLCITACLLFAGGAGNAIDRLSRGFVVDFIKTAFVDFPVFNVADIAVTVGAVLLIVTMLFFDKSGADGSVEK